LSRILPAAHPLRRRRVDEINAHYLAHVAIGFPITLEGNAETLQTAREVDGINWLTVKGLYEEAVLAGLGDEPGIAFLQTTSNARYYMTPNQALAIIRDLRAWSIAVWDRWNTLKNAARDPAQTPTAASLEMLNIEQGWP